MQGAAFDPFHCSQICRKGSWEPTFAVLPQMNSGVYRRRTPRISAAFLSSLKRRERVDFGIAWSLLARGLDWDVGH